MVLMICEDNVQLFSFLFTANSNAGRGSYKNSSNDQIGITKTKLAGLSDYEIIHCLQSLFVCWVPVAPFEAKKLVY